MVKKFTVPCEFAGQKHPITFYIGDSARDSHPIGFQSKWLGSEKGGKVPDELMESLSELKEIADRTKVSFEELCTYVIDEVNLSKPVGQIESKKDKND